MEEILKGKAGIAPQQVARMDVKGKLDITLTDGTSKTLTLEEVEKAVRQGCHSCADFSALDADISAGSVGTPEGFTTLIIRTETGNGFVDHAVSSGALVTSKDVDIAPIEKLASSKLKRISNS